MSEDRTVREMERALDEKDKVIERVVRVSAETLADAPAPIRTIQIFGVDVKAEVNINTIVLFLSLLSAIGSGAYFLYSTAIERPILNSHDIAQIQSEIGTPGRPGYLPGVVKGLGTRMDRVEKAIQDNHDETVEGLNEIKASIQSGNTDNAKRFDRLDNRIDRLVESTSERHPH